MEGRRREMEELRKREERQLKWKFSFIYMDGERELDRLKDQRVEMRRKEDRRGEEWSYEITERVKRRMIEIIEIKESNMKLLKEEYENSMEEKA